MTATKAKTKTAKQTSNKDETKGILDGYNLFYEELPDVATHEPTKEDTNRLKRASKQ